MRFQNNRCDFSADDCVYLHVTLVTNKTKLNPVSNNSSKSVEEEDFPKLQKSLDPPLKLNVIAVTNQDVMTAIMNAMNVMTQFLSSSGIKNTTNQ